jgi:hypothetical protein
VPELSSNRYQASVPCVLPSAAIKAVTSAPVSERSYRWNSSTVPARVASPYCDRPIQLFFGAPRSAGDSVIAELTPATDPST